MVVQGAPTPLLERAYGAVQHRLFRKKCYFELRHAVTRHYARQIQDRLRAERYDAVFAPGTIYLAALKSDVPAFATADACLGGLVDYYPEFTNLTRRDLLQGFEIERGGVRACRRIFYTSEWARQSAMDTAGARPEVAVTVPFGANLLEVPDETEVRSLVERRPDGPVKLLFVGVDWHRKGGGIALDAAQRINAQGVDAELHIVGGSVPRDVAEAPCVRHHGFLRKSDPEHLAKLIELYSTSHFLILPTRAECCAVVLAEACSYGLPILATRTGGVETAVVSGVSGYTFEYHECAGRYANKAMELAEDRVAYRDLCMSAWKLSHELLNWDVCADTWKREMLAVS